MDRRIAYATTLVGALVVGCSTTNVYQTIIASDAAPGDGGTGAIVTDAANDERRDSGPVSSSQEASAADAQIVTGDAQAAEATASDLDSSAIEAAAVPDDWRSPPADGGLLPPVLCDGQTMTSPGVWQSWSYECADTGHAWIGPGTPAKITWTGTFNGAPFGYSCDFQQPSGGFAPAVCPAGTECYAYVPTTGPAQFGHCR